MFNESFIKDAYNFIKLVKMLRNWKSKYKPEDYDIVIGEAFDLIDGYKLEPGKLSPPFTLPNIQLEEEFIKKFFTEANVRGYEVSSKPSEKEGFTTFNLKIGKIENNWVEGREKGNNRIINTPRPNVLSAKQPNNRK